MDWGNKTITWEIRIMNKTLLSLSIVALTACGGGNGADKANIFGGGGMGNIVGVWDATENLGDDGIDEVYFAFDKSGLLTFYDYAGDSYDQGANCYWIDIAEVRSLGNNNYEITTLGEDADEEPEEPDVVTITRKGDKLTIDSSNSEDPDQSINTFTKSTKSVSDFTPECQDVDSADARNKAGDNVKRFVQP
jgi:hypothetical protein